MAQAGKLFDFLADTFHVMGLEEGVVPQDVASVPHHLPGQGGECIVHLLHGRPHLLANLLEVVSRGGLDITESGSKVA